MQHEGGTLLQPEEHNFLIVSQIHKAIRDGNYEELTSLLLSNSQTSNTDTTCSSSNRSSSSSSSSSSHLLWEKNSTSGWTALHFAASHSMPLSWWKWILKEASKPLAVVTTTTTTSSGNGSSNIDNNYNNNKQNSRLFWMTELTNLGQSCIELFFKHWLHPLPWHRPEVHTNAQLLQESIQQCIDNRNILQQIRTITQSFHRFEQYIQEQTTPNNNHAEEEIHDTFVIHDYYRALMNTIIFFWYRMELLLRCIHWGSLHCSCNESSSSNSSKNNNYTQQQQQQQLQPPQDDEEEEQQLFPMLHVLAQTGCCPSIVARLVLALYPDQARQPIHGKLPLHTWAAAESYNHDCHNHHGNNNNTTTHNNDGNNRSDNERNAFHDGLLLPLIETYPQAVCSKDFQGRFPLHIALLSESKVINPTMSLLLLGENYKHSRSGRNDHRHNSSNTTTREKTQCSIANGNALLDACPDVLYQFDPILKVPCFALAAMPKITQQRIHLLAQQNSVVATSHSITATTTSTSTSTRTILLWCYLSSKSRQQKMLEAKEQLQCQHLSTIYILLRAYPNAVDIYE